GSQTGRRAVRLRRPLVEVLVLVGGGEGPQVARELPGAVDGDRRQGRLRRGLGIRVVGGGGEEGPEKLLGQRDAVVGAAAVGVERRVGLGLGGGLGQAAVLAGGEVGVGPGGARRTVVRQVRRA